MTRRTGYRAYAGIVVAAIAAEIVWISGAAAFGTASHFNESTPAMAALYAVMGMLAVTLTSATAVFAVGIARNRAFRAGPAARAALVLGLGLVLPLTLMTAGTLAQNGGHWVGGTPDDALGLPIMGWSRDGGDLRVPHFFATHAMHFVPAFGLVSMRLVGPARRWPVVAFAALYAAFTAAGVPAGACGAAVRRLLGMALGRPRGSDRAGPAIGRYNIRRTPVDCRGTIRKLIRVNWLSYGRPLRVAHAGCGAKSLFAKRVNAVLGG